MKKISGDPRKRQAFKNAELERSRLPARRRAMVMSRVENYQEETSRLLDLFEEQYPESSGYNYDDQPYMIALCTIVVHRAGCEIIGEPDKYKPLQQLDELELPPSLRNEVEEFLIRNQLDKSETYSGDFCLTNRPNIN